MVRKPRRRLAEVALLVGQEHVPEAAIAAGLLKQRQRFQRVKRILLAGEHRAETFVFGVSSAVRSVVCLDSLLAGLDFGKQGLLAVDQCHLMPGAERKDQQANHRQPEAGQLQPLADQPLAPGDAVIVGQQRNWLRAVAERLERGAERHFEPLGGQHRLGLVGPWARACRFNPACPFRYSSKPG